MTAPALTRDLFGSVQLGHLVVETDRFTDWRRFGADAIGLHVDELDSDTMRFRVDDHSCRFLLRRGGAEDVTAIGWHAQDDATLEALLERAAYQGLPVTEASAEAAALRGVERLWRFPGIKGTWTEVFTTPTRTAAPLRMQQTAFVTGDSGLGHVAITARDAEGIRGYYDTLFNARLSDWVHERMAGAMLRIRFLRLNERHHSIAVAGVRGLRIDPVRTAIQHLNTQVVTLDDLLASYERCIDLGFGMQWSVGQHTNDKELSYYVRTPSGFEWEVGWNPIVVSAEDELTWAPRTYDAISTWGHTPIGENVLTRLTQFRYAAGSALRGAPELPGDFTSAVTR